MKFVNLNYSNKIKQMKNDHSDLRFHGKFTKDYNQQQDVRENRFKSIDEKIQEKNFSSMDIFE